METPPEGHDEADTTVDDDPALLRQPATSETLDADPPAEEKPADDA
jgi:hypothetical protein